MCMCVCAQGKKFKRVYMYIHTGKHLKVKVILNVFIL